MPTIDEILLQDNVLDILDDEQISYIASEVYRGYEQDLSSRGEWNDSVDEWTRLASQTMEAKNTPWQGASNIKYPLVTEGSIQFSSRMYPAMVPNNSPAKGRVLGYDPQGQKLNRATRISKHMSYQLLEEMEEWEEVQDKVSMLTAVVGCAFKKMYFCPIRKRPLSVLVHAKNFVTNYYTQDLPSCRRYSHELELYGNDIISMQRLGLYSDIDLRTPEQKQNDIKNQLHGLTAPQVDSATPYLAIEQMAYFDLDGDGYDEPYNLTLDLGTKQLLRIAPCFDEDGVVYTAQGEIQDIKRKQYFVKYGLLPSPDGSFYDYGFGQYVGPLNYALNSIFNQLIDAGTLSNRGGGFISKGIRIKGGALRLKIGEYQAVNATGDDLRKGIFPAPIKEPSPTLLNLATFLITSGQRLSSTLDSQVGQDPGQNQKATTTMAVQEQGQKVFGGIYKRFIRSFKQELKILFQLNKDYLEPESYFIMLDSDQPQAILLQDYQTEGMDVVPSADPSFNNEQQKLQKAMAAMDLANQGLANRQLAGQMIADAMELPNKEQLLNVPQPPPALEEREFEDQSMRAWAELRLKAFELSEIKGPEARARALKAIADAEAIEPGRQLEAYKAVLTTLDRELDRELKQQSGANSGQTGEMGASTGQTGDSAV